MSASLFSSGYSIPNTVSDGLFVPIGGGSNTVTGLTVSQAAQTLTMTARSTNYGYIDPVTGLVTVNTTGFTSGQVPLFIATADTFNVTAINDVRVTYTSAAGGSGTPALPFTSVQFNNSGIFGGDSSLTWDNTLKNLTVAAPAGNNNKIILQGSTTRATTLELHNSFASGIDIYAHADIDFRAPTLIQYRSRGTQALPTAILNNDSLGYIEFAGYTGSVYDNNALLMQVLATENWSGTNRGTKLDIYVIPTGASVNIKAISIGGDSTGTITIGRALSVGGNVSGTTAGLILPIAGSPTSAGTAGITGQIAWDSSNWYVCTSGGIAGSATWKKAALVAA